MASMFASWTLPSSSPNEPPGPSWASATVAPSTTITIDIPNRRPSFMTPPPGSGSPPHTRTLLRQTSLQPGDEVPEDLDESTGMGEVHVVGTADLDDDVVGQESVSGRSRSARLQSSSLSAARRIPSLL